jgi:hypothetical protein
MGNNLEIIYHSGLVVRVNTGQIQQYASNGHPLPSGVREGVVGCDADFVEYSMQHCQPLRIVNSRERVVKRLVDMHNVREVRNLNHSS